MLPAQKSFKWINVFFIYAAIVFIGLIISRLILGTIIDIRLIIAFVILSIGSAILPVIAGYLGRQLFFKIYVSSNVVGLLYMITLVMSDRAPEWADLTSIVVYVYLLPVGAVLGLLAEVILYIKKRKSNRKDN